MKIQLIPYSKELHLDYLKKWLTDKKLMKGWGMSPFVDSTISEWAGEPNRVVLMVEDLDLEKIVGFVNFYDWDREKKVASRGTLIEPKYQNRGYGKVAILESNKYAFKKMNLERIELYVDKDNEVSKHITEKLGYKLDRYDDKKKRYWYYMDKNEK